MITNLRMELSRVVTWAEICDPNIAINCHQDNEPKYFALQITDTDGVGTKHLHSNRYN